MVNAINFRIPLIYRNNLTVLRTDGTTPTEKKTLKDEMKEISSFIGLRISVGMLFGPTDLFGFQSWR